MLIKYILERREENNCLGRLANIILQHYDLFIWRMLCVAIIICELATYVTITTACMHNNNGAIYVQS